MFRGLSILVLMCSAFAASASAGAQEGAPARLGPSEAIAAAAAEPRIGARGLFQMRVASVGRADRRVYLNSELDYRNPNNLSADVLPSVVRALAARHGATSEDFLIGKQIEVRGTARRVPIRITEYGRPAGRYYQTRIVVTEVDRISVID